MGNGDESRRLSGNMVRKVGPHPEDDEDPTDEVAMRWSAMAALNSAVEEE